MGIVCIALTLYWLAILVRIVLSWFPIGSGSPIAPVNSFLFAIDRAGAGAGAAGHPAHPRWGPWASTCRR